MNRSIEMDCTYQIHPANNITLNDKLFLLDYIKAYSLDSHGYTIFKQIFPPGDNENFDLMFKFEKGTYYYQQCVEIDTSSCNWLSWEIISRINKQSICMLKVKEGVNLLDPQLPTIFNVSNPMAEKRDQSKSFVSVHKGTTENHKMIPIKTQRNAKKNAIKSYIQMENMNSQFMNVNRRITNLEYKTSLLTTDPGILSYCQANVHQNGQ